MGQFYDNSLLVGKFGGLVMENGEGLVEGGGHGHHLLLLRTRKADPWPSPSPSEDWTGRPPDLFHNFQWIISN